MNIAKLTIISMLLLIAGCKTIPAIPNKSAIYYEANGSYIIENITPMDFCHEMIYVSSVIKGFYRENNSTMRWENDIPRD